jgi:hypothetical protein
MHHMQYCALVEDFRCLFQHLYVIQASLYALQVLVLHVAQQFFHIEAINTMTFMGCIMINVSITNVLCVAFYPTILLLSVALCIRRCVLPRLVQSE